MSELNFPKNPAVGQEYTFNSLLYMFDGVKWVTKGTGYNPVQDLYEMLASDAGASFVGANGHDNVQAALEAIDTNLQAQINTKINADFVSRFDREALRRSYADAGYKLVDGSFELGGTVTTATDVLLYEAEGKAYSWEGVLPKVASAASTPYTTGGVAEGAWILVGDAALRTDLSSSAGAGLVGTSFGETVQAQLNRARLSTTASEIASNLALGSAKVVSSVINTEAYVVPSFATLEGGEGFLTGFIGTTYSKNKTIRKSSNATVTLSNQDASAGSQEVDAVVYQDPAWPGGAVFPQKSSIKHLTIEGNSSANPNQAGIFILQGGVVDIENIDTINCTNSIWAKDIWQSRISRVFSNNGKIRLDNGTSVVLTGCGLASADTIRTGAFDLTGMKYSTLISCTSDNTTNTAYSFNACEGIVLNACGSEGANTTTANSGTALAFRDNNHNIVVNAFTCFPVANQGSALISFGSNNQVTLNSFEVIPGIPYNGDIFLYGANSNITINGGRFGLNGYAMPIIIASADAIGSIVTFHHSNGKTYVYKVIAAGIVNPVERRYANLSILVTREGDIARGTGASCVRTSTGNYTITLDNPTDIISTVATLFGNDGVISTVIVGGDVINVRIVDLASAALNSAFSLVTYS